MGNLFISFSIAIAGAIGLITMSKVLDFDAYLNRILPVVPILYAIIYEVIERKKATKIGERFKASQPRAEALAFPARQSTLSHTAGRIVLNAAISLAIKFSLEMLLMALFLRISGQTFAETYGAFSIEIVGRLLRGDHPWLVDAGGVYILALIAILTCVLTGLWIGYTARGTAILEGVLAGTAVTFLMSMTNMLTLYRRIEEVTVQLADAMGYVMRAGFLIVILLQVLLYGLWSGIVQMGKEERALKAAGKKGR